MREGNVKIVHLINDNGPFLSWIKEMFNREEISNEYVIINSKGNNERNQNNDFHCNLTKKGQEAALEILNKNEIAIHYFLDYTKSDLILKSNTTVKHYWYFFGADVYQQLNIFRKKIYGVETQRWMRFSLTYRFRLELRAIKQLILRQRATPKVKLLKSFQRIEKVLWYVEDEIKWINSKIKTPEFQFFKFFNFENIFPFDSSQLNESSNTILIGNSATLENNHLDVLKVFEKYGLHDVNVFLPLSYGNVLKYKSKVINKYASFFGDKLHIQESTLPLNDYYSNLNGCPTAIMYHYRQQALGNIFYLIANGTKIYLSKNNILLNWLKKNNLKVYCFEDEFIRDYEKGELTLSKELRQHNIDNLRVLLNESSTFVTNLINQTK